MRNTAVRASAGTGKTHELATQLIARLAAGVPPSAIVATTFTRKAAGEILTRVMARLALAAESELDRLRLNDDLRRARCTLGLNHSDLSQEQCRTVLRATCSELHRLTVCTIDALFVRMLGAYGLDIGLGSLPRISEPAAAEARRVRALALRQVLEQMPREVALDMLSGLVGRRSVRNVSHTLDQAVEDLYDLAQTLRDDTSHTVPVQPLTGPSDPTQLVAALRLLADEVASVRLANAIRDTAGRLESRKWTDVLTKGPTGKLAAGEAEYWGASIEGVLRERLGDAIALSAARLLADLNSKSQALMLLLRRFSTVYRASLLARDLLLFSDVPVLLGKLLASREGTDLAYRLDIRLEHLLLDEFQDTNAVQWSVLRQLLPAERGSVFCAGDSKQAIYGWRGGCAAIFDRLDADIPGIVWEYRQTNYRSSRVVLELVDAVFQHLDRVADLQKYQHVVQDWQRTYRPHVAARDIAGHVTIRMAPACQTGSEETGDAEESQDEEPSGPLSYVQWVAQLVRGLAADHPSASVGILTRTNPFAARLALAMQSLGLAATQEGPGVLCDDPAVELILSAMHLADHPGSTAEAYHVYHSPLRAELAMSGDDAASYHSASLRLRTRLAGRGYAAVVSDFARVLAPFGDARTAQRLTQLVEAAAEYDRTPTSRPADFVEYVRCLTVNEAFPARIRIMTIHQSKGLEFDIVVLPELHHPLFARQPVALAVRDDATGPVRAFYAWPVQGVARASTVLRAAVDDHRAGECREALNLLYVAMTRSRHALHIVLLPGKRRKDGNHSRVRFSLATILLDSLRCESMKEGILYERGEPAWELDGVGPERAQAFTLTTPTRPAFDRSRPRRLWPQIAPSELMGETARVADLLRLERDPLDRGAALHACFQTISWLDDAIPSRDALMEAVCAAAPDHTTEWYDEVIAQFLRIVDQPVTRSLLTRPPEPAILLREQPFAIRWSGKLIAGRMDRVVLRETDAGPAVVITDFKTDAVASEAVPARARLYGPQMRAYAEAASFMYHVPCEHVEVQLMFVVPDRLYRYEGADRFEARTDTTSCP